MTRLTPALFFVLIAASAWAPAAMAGGVNLGSVAQVPAIGGMSSRSVVPGMSGTVGNNTYGSVYSGAGSVSGGMNVSNSDGVTVQTNIDASRNVQAGSNVSVNETFNGVPGCLGTAASLLSAASKPGLADGSDLAGGGQLRSCRG
jgi:hypothetical protein